MLRRIWRAARTRGATVLIVLAMLVLCFLMTMVAFGLIVSKINRTYAVLATFITTFVLTIPSHYLLIRLVYKLTGTHFLDKYERDREVAALRAELAERAQEAQSRRNNQFPQERGQKVGWVPVWEQRIDQPIFDSVPYAGGRRVRLDRSSLLVRGAKKMYHWVVPVKIMRGEKPDKEERLFVAGHITGLRVFWIDAEEIVVNADDPARFLVYGLDERRVHAGFLDDAETPSFRVEKYFSWAVSARGGNYASPDSIRKFELIRDDEPTARASRIALHWEKLVADIKADTSRVMGEVLAAARDKIAATLKAIDGTRAVEFADGAPPHAGNGQQLLRYVEQAES